MSRAPLVAFLPLVALLGACGGGPELINLRCRQNPCQDKENPFMLLLAVDFDDPSGTLSTGALELRLDGKTQVAVALKDVFAAQGLEAGAAQGTLAIDQDLFLDRVTQGKELVTSIVVRNGEGQESNEPALGFRMALGSSGP